MVEKSLTQRGFWEAEEISKSKFYDLCRKGLGPDMMDIDGLKRITPEAHERWRREREAAAKRRETELAEAGPISATAPFAGDTVVRGIGQMGDRSRRQAARSVAVDTFRPLHRAGNGRRLHVQHE
jgi:hypothetical protein